MNTCEGVSKSGYRKGMRCSNTGTRFLQGGWYCLTHYKIELKDAEDELHD